MPMSKIYFAGWTLHTELFTSIGNLKRGFSGVCFYFTKCVFNSVNTSVYVSYFFINFMHYILNEKTLIYMWMWLIMWLWLVVFFFVWEYVLGGILVMLCLLIKEGKILQYYTLLYLESDTAFRWSS